MRKREEMTWQTPDIPAMESKPKAFVRKSFNRDGSVLSLGGGPGTVGRTRTASSFNGKQSFEGEKIC